MGASVSATPRPGAYRALVLAMAYLLTKEYDRSFLEMMHLRTRPSWSQEIKETAL